MCCFSACGGRCCLSADRHAERLQVQERRMKVCVCVCLFSCRCMCMKSIYFSFTQSVCAETVDLHDLCVFPLKTERFGMGQRAFSFSL